MEVKVGTGSRRFGRGCDQRTALEVYPGCFFYFHYACVEGLYEYGNLFEWDKSMATNRGVYLTGRFGAHFLAVSLLVYLVMLVATWLGVYLPARTISRISPVEALKGD